MTIIDGIEIRERAIIDETAETATQECIDSLSIDCFQCPTDLWRKGTCQSHPQQPQLPSLTLRKGQTRQSRARSRSTVSHPTRISGKHRRGDGISPDNRKRPVKKTRQTVPSLAHEKRHVRVSHALLNPNTNVLLQRCKPTSRTKKGDLGVGLVEA